MAFTFAIESYYQTAENKANDIHVTPQWIELVDLILIIYLTFDFLLFFFIHTENRIMYLFSFDSFITYLTIIPTGLLRMGVIIDPIVIDKYYLIFWRVLRLFSVMRLGDWFTKKSFPLARVQFKLVLTLIIILYIFGSAQMLLENSYKVGIMKAEMAMRNNLEEYPDYVWNEDDYENMVLY